MFIRVYEATIKKKNLPPRTFHYPLHFHGGLIHSRRSRGTTRVMGTCSEIQPTLTLFMALFGYGNCLLILFAFDTGPDKGTRRCLRLALEAHSGAVLHHKGAV